MELGVQIYGCMREFRADPEAFCARLKTVGYTPVSYTHLTLPTKA